MDGIVRDAQQQLVPPARIQVLIVEDEPVLRSSVARGLARLLHADVWDAASVAEARLVLERIRPQIVLCDLDLPDGVGLDVLAALDRKGYYVPVVFISAYVSTYKRSIPSRANIQVREKPVSLAELRRLIEQQLALPPQGETSPFSPSDYIQLAAMGRHSVRLDFERAGEPAGSMVIFQGELWSVVDKQGEGEPALRRLLFSSCTLAHCTMLSGEPSRRSFTESSQSLLMEAARQQDEEERAAHPPPPAAPMRAEGKRPCFEDLFESGVDALLRKDYAGAWESFAQAAVLRPEDLRVAANLKRLHALGFSSKGGT